MIQSVEDTNTLHLHTSDLTLHTSHHFIVGEQPAGRGGGEDHGLHGGDQGEEEGQWGDCQESPAPAEGGAQEDAGGQEMLREQVQGGDTGKSSHLGLSSVWCVTSGQSPVSPGGIQGRQRLQRGRESSQESRQGNL